LEWELAPKKGAGLGRASGIASATAWVPALAEASARASVRAKELTLGDLTALGLAFAWVSA